MNWKSQTRWSRPLTWWWKGQSTGHHSWNKRLTWSVRFSPFSNIILRLLRGTLGFSASDTSAAAASCPSESLLGFSMSVRSSCGAECSWLVPVSVWSSVSRSVSWSCGSVVVVKAFGCLSICDVGLRPVGWLTWLWGSAGIKVWGWGLWLAGGCRCSQRFFKSLRFPLRSVERRSSATCREK